jgi:two-component system, sensor histidine kinase and response regulator
VAEGSTKTSLGNEEFFRLIFENAQIGIGIFDIAKQQHASNQALQRMLGYTEEQLSLLDRWDDIIHPDERDPGAKRYAKLASGENDADEYTQRFIRPDGEIVTASGRFTLIRDAAGKPSHVIALHEDVTQWKRAEETRRRNAPKKRAIASQNSCN